MKGYSVCVHVCESVCAWVPVCVGVPDVLVCTCVYAYISINVCVFYKPIFFQLQCATTWFKGDTSEVEANFILILHPKLFRMTPVFYIFLQSLNEPLRAPGALFSCSPL